MPNYDKYSTDQLEEMDKAYREAQPRAPGEFSDLPDGTYHVVVDKVEIKNSQNANLYLNWTLKVFRPAEFMGRNLFLRNMLQTPDNMTWLKTNLGICGVEMQSLKELPAKLKELLDVCIEVRKRTRQGQNDSSNYDIYLSKAVDPPEDGIPLDKAGTPF